MPQGAWEGGFACPGPAPIDAARLVQGYVSDPWGQDPLPGRKGRIGFFIVRKWAQSCPESTQYLIQREESALRSNNHVSTSVRRRILAIATPVALLAGGGL